MNTQASSSFAQATPTFARQLVERLSSRLANEKHELCSFLIELAEFDAKKLALELGYPSTLACLVGELGVTESSACRRITAARLLARFPQIAPRLLSARLTLMGLVTLKDVLDESNVDDVLERAAGLSEPEVRQLVMGIKLKGAAPSRTIEVAADQLALATPAAASVAADPVATPPHVPQSNETPREELEPMTLWVGREFRDELAAVRALLSHAVPSGKKEDVLLHVLRMQRKAIERRRHGSPRRARTSTAAKNTSMQQDTLERCDGSGSRPSGSTTTAETLAQENALEARPGSPMEVSNPTTPMEVSNSTTPAETPPKARYIPASVRREVYERDGGCCAYVGAEGRRCGSTFRLEYHHIVPFERGGPSTTANLSIICHDHNLLQAEKDFGPDHMKRKQLEGRVLKSLIALGYKRAQAEHAVANATSQLTGQANLETLLRKSLRLLAR